MSDQPTGAHPPADGEPMDPLAGPTGPLDALSSEPYPSGPGATEPDRYQSTAAPESDPMSVLPPAPAGQDEPASPPMNPSGPGVPPAGPPQPMTSAPSVPPAPSGFEAGPDDQAPTAAAAPARRLSPVLKRLGVALIGVVVVVLGRTAFDRTSADVLEVGQCVSHSGNEIAQVDCADAKAKYKVLLIQKDTEKSSIESVCSAATETTTSYFESKEGETKGNVICLSDLS